jgi:predicted kinase
VPPAARTSPDAHPHHHPWSVPASGKTTWATARLAEDPMRARSNWDDLRALMFGRPGILERSTEELITRVQQATVRSLLDAGRSVVVVGTHLRLRYARAWADLAAAAGADFVVRDFIVPLDELLRRDADRIAAGKRGVGEKVIRDLYARFAHVAFSAVTPTPAPAAPVVRQYVPDEMLTRAWLVDVDGTLALMGDRGPFEWHRVGEDTPNLPVLELVSHLPGPDRRHVRPRRVVPRRHGRLAEASRHPLRRPLHAAGR